MRNCFILAGLFALLAPSAEAAQSAAQKKMFRDKVGAKLPEFKKCYEKLPEPKPSGELRYQILIASSGKVQGVNFDDGTLRNDELEACVVGVFKTIQFTKGLVGKDGMEVTYPLTFGEERKAEPPMSVPAMPEPAPSASPETPST